MASNDSAARPKTPPRELGWGGEFAALLALGWPLITAQLAQNTLFLTDVIMTGWLGPQYLAAGTIASSFFNLFLLGAIGLVGAVAPIVAQARGARQFRSVRRAVRQGLWVAIVLTAVLTPIVWQVRPVLEALHQTPEIVGLAEGFLHAAVWVLAPALALMVMRAFLAAHGATRIILIVTLGGVVLNALLDWLLIFGNWGLPRLELTGAGLSTTLVNIAMFLAMLVYILTHKRYRRYHILARFWKPDWVHFRQIFRIGTPIGLTIMAEIGLFASASALMGMLGTNELAAHAIALQCAAMSFMVPLGLSQATTVRVGLAYGAGNVEGVRKAGWASFALTVCFMSLTCGAYLLFPQAIVRLFLDPSAPQNQAALGLAASYLAIAGIFQLADGTQVIAASALRGLSDTKVPMWLALGGYWVCGLPIAYVCGFTLGWRGTGVWIGLAAGLAIVAFVLTIRFARRDRLGLTRRVAPVPIAG
jgi:MATE family multidrug resistance protein